jgi:AraC family transcriptional regulator
MGEQTPSWILHGEFGRVTINTTHQAIVEHVHRELNVIIKLSGADTQLRAESRLLDLDDGAVLLFNPWVPHAKLASPEGPTTILSLFLDPDWLSMEFGRVRGDVLFPNLKESLLPEVRNRANRLAAAISHTAVDFAEDCARDLRELVDSVLQTYSQVAPMSMPLANARPSDYRIRRALAYIHEHAAQNPKIDEIARCVGLSRSRFFEQFRRCVGVSPRHYLDSLRLRIATQWLTTTDRPLVELADELGFGAHSNFTRFFTQHVALSPSEFRRQTIGRAKRDDGAPRRAAHTVRRAAG